VSEQRRIIFKTAVLVWKCIHGVATPYLQEFFVQMEKVQGRPLVWNSLSLALRDSSLTLNTLQRWLKTHLIGQSRSPFGAVVAFLYDSGAGYKCQDLLTYL